MNLHTFKDVLSSKKSSLINDTAVEEDEEEEEAGELAEEVEGEVGASEERFNDAGEVIEPFNLKEERERGKFDSNLNFVFEKENAEVDAWVAGLDEAEMEKAIGEAAVALKRRRDLEISKVEAADGRRVKGSYLELCLTLLGLMRPGETISRAMKRIKTEDGSIKATSTSKLSSKNSSISSPRVELITDLADQLISFGLTGIYGMLYEAIEAIVSLWEYQSADGTVHGPFPYSTIESWKQQGYFTGATAVPMRRVLDIHKKSRDLMSNKDDRGRDELALEDSDDEDDGSRGRSRKRVKFATDKKGSSAVDDLMNDLNDDEEDEEEDNKIARSRREKSAGREEGPSTERLLALAALTSSFDSSGRGPWIMSDDAVGFEEEIDDDDVADV